MPWQAIVSSAIGVSHIDSGICQDAGDYDVIKDDELIIGVVSDGMGSAQYSQIGSELAVKVAISELKQVPWQFEYVDKGFVNDVFQELLKTVKNRINHQAEASDCNVQDLACTLIVFIASANWLAAMQVGDGLLVGRRHGGEYELLIKPDKGEYINETVSITDTNSQENLKIYIKLNGFEFICAATDGIENICLRKECNWHPHQRFFKPLEKHLNSDESKLQKQNELKSFLNSERINQATDDDKTMLLCSYRKNVNIVRTLKDENKTTEESKKTYDKSKNKQDSFEKEQYKSVRFQSEESSNIRNEDEPQLIKQKHISTFKFYSHPKILSNLKLEVKPKPMLDENIEKLRQYVSLKVSSAASNPNNLPKVKIKRRKKRDFEILETWIICKNSTIPNRQVKQIIQQGIKSLKLKNAKRVKVFNICLGERGKIKFIKHFNIIHSLELATLTAALTGVYCFVFLLLRDLLLFELGLGETIIILLYSIATIPLLIFYFYAQSRWW